MSTRPALTGLEVAFSAVITRPRAYSGFRVSGARITKPYGVC